MLADAIEKGMGKGGSDARLATTIKKEESNDGHVEQQREDGGMKSESNKRKRDEGTDACEPAVKKERLES